MLLQAGSRLVSLKTAELLSRIAHRPTLPQHRVLQVPNNNIVGLIGIRLVDTGQLGLKINTSKSDLSCGTLYGS